MDFIIVAILIVVVIIGINATKKHFKGQGGCCGGSEPVKREVKELDQVIGQKIVIVDGMTCDHCAGWVEKAINKIDGASAKVDLKKKQAIVSLAKEVSDDQIKAAVKQAGYIVLEIK